MQIYILNLNIKTVESKHFIHYLKRFPQTLPCCFVMPASKHDYIKCFLILVQSLSACIHFQESLIFSNTKLSSVMVLHFPFKWPRQEAKTKQQ